MRHLAPLLLGLILLLGLAPVQASSLFTEDANPQGAMSDLASESAGPRTFDGERDGFLPVDRAFRLHAWREGERVWFGAEIEPGYYLYRHRIAVSSDQPDVILGEPALPVGEFKSDPYMGDVNVFHQRLEFSVPLERAPASGALQLTLEYQGCAEAGLCYPPERRTFAVDFGERPAVFDAPLPAEPATAPAQRDDGISLWRLGLLFLAGLGLTFTPCVLPMLPIVSALVVGRAPSRRRALALSCCYVGGMVAAYTLLGLVIGLLGAGFNLQGRLQSPWVVVPFAAVFVLLAAWTLDWLRPPSTGFGNRISALEERLRRLGPGGLILAGAVSTLIVTPCLSAPLAGILAYLSTTGNAAHGALALFVLGLGMGVPLILVCVFGASILPNRGMWMERVRMLCAIALLGVALWLVSTWLPGSLVLCGWGVLGIATALALGALESTTAPLLRALALALALWSGACVIGAAMGQNDPLRPLAGVGSERSMAATEAPSFATITRLDELDAAAARAREAGRPLLVDLYADWCVSCKRIEAELFPRAEISALLEGFERVRFDLTDDSEDARGLLSRYGLFGPPTLLFFDASGERGDLRVQGEPSASSLKAALERAGRLSRP